MSLRYLSVCSGIEAATQAWSPLGWTPVAFSEIEKFPSAVLAHHYPDVPNLGDMTKFEDWPDANVDVLCGGTPCQSFSIAGLRQGLADPRGNLMLTFGGIAKRYRPRWLVWENVPGVLSSNRGRDFAAFLSLLGQLGYGVAYRVLDAQYVRTRRFRGAVPQRRRRVFVVGYLGDWRRAAAVLFDRESLSGHPAPRREAGKGFARGFECGPQGGGFADVAPTLDTRCKDGPIRNQLGAGVMCAEIAPTLNAHFDEKQGLEDQHINGGGGYSYVPPVVPQAMSAKWSKGSSGPAGDEIANLVAQTGGGFDVAHALRGEGFDASEDGTGRGTPLVPVAYGLTTEQTPKFNEECALTLTKQSPTGGGQVQCVAFDCLAGGNTALSVGDVPGALHGGGKSGGRSAVAFSCKDYGADASDEVVPTMRAMGSANSHPNAGGQLAVAFQNRVRGDDGRGYDRAPSASIEVCGTLETVKPYHIAMPWAVRRLTPTECERLMGFPDGFTQIPWRGKPADKCPDGPRYKALGNSWAVNAAEWIGERIAIVDGWDDSVGVLN